MKQYIILSLLLVLFSCNTKQESKKTAQNFEEKEESVVNNQINKTNIINPTLEGLQGVWAENEEENALFFIKNDSLYYVEQQDNAINIELKGDTLLIMGDVPVICKILKLTEDSLWYIDEYSDIPTKLYKR